MLTTVLIGNSSSFCRENLLITPRGYRNKYQEDGSTLDGEQSGRSLSMGLDGWKAQVRHYLQNHPDVNLPAVARHFEMPLGEILSAISAADQDSPAGCYSAQPVTADVEQLLQQCGDWERLRVIVRSAGGAIAELLVKSSDFQRRGDWLNLENDNLHLHVDLSNVAQAYRVQKHGEEWGIFLLDSHGEPVLYWLKA